jgi:hypothetical protein
VLCPSWSSLASTPAGFRARREKKGVEEAVAYAYNVIAGATGLRSSVPYRGWLAPRLWRLRASDVVVPKDPIDASRDTLHLPALLLPRVQELHLLRLDQVSSSLLLHLATPPLQEVQTCSLFCFRCCLEPALIEVVVGDRAGRSSSLPCLTRYQAGV